MLQSHSKLIKLVTIYATYVLRYFVACNKQNNISTLGANSFHFGSFEHNME
jgi:hypothetical protein